MVDTKIPIIIAGSCLLQDNGLEAAKFLKDNGADIFRAKIWGGGTHFPKDPKLWGKGRVGIKYMHDIQRLIKIPVITEIRQIYQFQEWVQHFDLLWIAARSMQDYFLLKEINRFAKYNKLTVILKRGFGNTIDEVLGTVEYLNNVNDLFVCERGINTFDRTSDIRWRPDILGIIQLKERGLKVIFDPSHSVGLAKYIMPISKAALEAGADGLMVEVSKDPETAWSDQKQALDFDGFKDFMQGIKKWKGLGSK